jgi:hypothetical protein
MLLLLLFIMACHLFTHRLATRHPHLQFGPLQGISEVQPGAHPGHHMSWFDWQAFWGAQTSDLDGKREFVVAESLPV